MSFITADEFRKRRQARLQLSLAPYETMVAKVRTQIAEMMDKSKEGNVEVTRIDKDNTNICHLQLLPAWNDLCTELNQLGFTLTNPQFKYDEYCNGNFYYFCCTFALAEPTVA